MLVDQFRNNSEKFNLLVEEEIREDVLNNLIIDLNIYQDRLENSMRKALYNWKHGIVSEDLFQALNATTECFRLDCEPISCQLEGEIFSFSLSTPVFNN